MYVGDEPRDVMAAMNAGYGASVAVATGPASYRMLSNHPQYRADFVMRSMSELIGLLERLKGDQRLSRRTLKKAQAGRGGREFGAQRFKTFQIVDRAKETAMHMTEHRLPLRQQRCEQITHQAERRRRGRHQVEQRRLA